MNPAGIGGGGGIMKVGGAGGIIGTGGIIDNGRFIGAYIMEFIDIVGKLTFVSPSPPENIVFGLKRCG